MRVGLDARLAGPGLGVSTLMRGLACRLPEAGVEVVWIGEPAHAPASVAEVVAPPPPGFPGLDSPMGHRLAESLGLDLLHFTANSGWWSRGAIPHVVTVHDLIWSRRKLRGHSARQVLGHAYLRYAVPRAVAGAAAVTVPSSVTAGAVRERYGVGPRVIPNGVADEWRRVPAPAVEPPYVVAFAGRHPRKGTEISVDAWTRLAPRGVGLRLLTGAGVPPAVTRRMPDLRRRGDATVVPYLPLSELVAVVAGAVALIYPSREEGFGLPVAEAMMAGVPVITGLTPVTGEVGGDAILKIDGSDPVSSIVRHVGALVDDPAQRMAIAARGRERAAALTWAEAVASYRTLYSQVLGE
jgi:glycosyltransferase involved in cell wall biosynthesis